MRYLRVAYVSVLRLRKTGERLCNMNYSVVYYIGMTHIHDIIWLAGILEGEGSFNQDKRRNDFYSVIELSMTDKDIVERAAQIMNELGGSSCKVNARKKREGWKQQWRVTLYGNSAETIMKAILPFMGERRSNRITQLLADRAKAVQFKKENPVKKGPPITKFCGTRASYSRGCRCVRCKSANTEYARSLRKNK
jgi:hypothetical protein